MSGKASRKRRLGLVSGIVSIVFVIGILVLANLISVRHKMQFDLTGNRQFTLAPQTEKILENLKEPVTAYCYFREFDEDYETAKDLLGIFDSASSKFSFRYVDPDKDPVMARKFNVNQYSTIVLEQGERFRKVTEPTEQAMTNGLIKLIQGDTQHRIRFSTGHGELDTESMENDGLMLLKMALQDANYQTDTINLMAEEPTPDNCDVLAIIGPMHEPVDEVIGRIRKYLAAGGHLLIALEPGSGTGFSGLLETFGIRWIDAVVIDPKGYQNALQPIVQDYPAHEITDQFNSGLVFHVAGAFETVDPPVEGRMVRNLAMTTAEAYLKSDLESLKTGQFDPDFEKDLKGPVAIAVTSESIDIDQSDGVTDTGARIIALGDSDFLNNIFMTFAAHLPFIMNAFHWLSDEKDLIAIPPRETVSQPLLLEPAQWLIGIILVALLPLVTAVFGLVRILSRRIRA